MDRQSLLAKYGQPPIGLTNGLVIKVHKDTANLPSITSANWILMWMGNHDVTPKILRSKIFRVVEKSTKMRGKALEKFKAEKFTLPAPTQPVVPSPSQPDIQSPTQPDNQSPTQPDNQSPTQPVLPSPPQATEVRLTSSPPSPTLQSVPRPKNIRTPKKKLNTLQHQISKCERHLSIIQKKITTLRNEWVQQGQDSIHYAIKNVKKREERNEKARKDLKKDNRRLAVVTTKLEDECLWMKRDLRELKMRNGKLEKTVLSQRKKLNGFRKERKALRRRVGRRPSTKKSLEAEQICDEWDGDVVIDTKKDDGEYNTMTRFCVMELTGLEVATGKIAQVMETVGELCGVTFSNLPSVSCCQRIVDEGQAIAKVYIRENVLKKRKSFGVHKDGTTRKKVKILDTSICTDEGESFCLGWSSVVSETGNAIAAETKDKLEEVGGSSPDDMLDIWNKLNYFMNDRAANEKKSSRILDEWREEILKESEYDVKNVKHLYCAAHVLLGFHTYVLNAVKKLEFLSSDEQKHPVTVLLKDASDIFGPVGDYRGLRNQWEAFCIDNNKKSVIKSYKDNRFNGLFEVAAQVFHHRHDFIAVLKCQQSRNTKQQRLYKSLLNSHLMLLIECLALYFHAVTGPYWNMVISSKTSHTDFRNVIHQLKTSLEKCQENPAYFFQPQSFACMSFPSSSTETKEKLTKRMKGENMENVMSAICIGLLTTVNVQLKDVLDEEGDDHECVHAPLTNLVCERHFGHLDASQRRQPHGSLHHHSSVILLKQTRKSMRRWFVSLSSDEKEKLWSEAKKEGRELRKKHQERDRNAVMASLKVKISEKAEHVEEDIKEGQMIAVACEDTWYPALVEAESMPGQDVAVNFAALGKGQGSFFWPTGKDRQTVNRKSVIETNVEYEPRAGGRHWSVTNAKQISEKFKKFK